MLLNNFLKFYFLYLRGREKKKHKKEVFHLLVDSSNGLNCWGRARQKAATINSILVSHLVGKGQNTWVIISCLPRYIIKGFDHKQSNQWSKVDVTDSGLTQYTATATNYILSMKEKELL